MSKELGLITSIAAKGYIDDSGIIKTVLEHMSEITAFELQQIADTEVIKYTRYLMSDCGNTGCADDLTFGEMIELIGELDKGYVIPSAYYSKWMLAIMMNAGRYNLWFRAFAAISMNKLREFLESALDCDDDGKPFRKLLGKFSDGEITAKTTVGDVMGRIRGHIMDSWTPGTDLENYTQKINSCCEDVIDLLKGLCMADIGSANKGEAEYDFDDYDEFEDYPFSVNYKGN